MPPKESLPHSPLYRDAELGLRAATSPLFLTYHMLDWGSLAQKPSPTRCVSCGGEMMSVEPVRDEKGLLYDGLVCHHCKSLLWSRSR